MIPNTDPETGIRYGCIGLQKLESDIAQEIFDLIHDKAYEDYFAANPQDISDAEFYIDEPSADIEYQGMVLHGFWLGGAFNLLVVKSRVIVFCSECSPCVKNAGNLEDIQDQTTGQGVLAYSVPKDWLADK